MMGVGGLEIGVEEVLRCLVEMALVEMAGSVAYGIAV